MWWSVLLACAPAWHPEAPARFDLEVPEGWFVTRNARWFGNDFFTIRAPEGGATVSIECVRLDARSRRMPADLVAETRALEMGRSLGVTNTRWRVDRIDIDGHEAWAVTGRRTWHAEGADYSLVAIRLARHAAFVTLQVPRGRLGAYTLAWSRLLAGLDFPQDEVAADAPIFDAEE